MFALALFGARLALGKKCDVVDPDVPLVSVEGLARSGIGARAAFEIGVITGGKFNELSSKDMDETGDDPDEIVDKIQKKTGQPRSQVEKRVTHVAKQTGAGAPKHSNSPKQKQKQKQKQTTGASGSNKR